MLIRTRRFDQASKPTEHIGVGIETDSSGYVTAGPDKPIVRDDGSLLLHATLHLRGTYLISIQLSDEELRQIVAARLRAYPEATMAAIGSAMAEAADGLGTVTPTDPLLSAGIVRTRSRSGVDWIFTQKPSL